MALLTTALMTLSIHSLALPGLGFSVSFTPTGESGAEAAGSIWMGLEQGTLGTREIVIRSQSDDTTQMLDFEIYDQVLVDGEREVDYSELSELADWVSFSPRNPQIGPGESVTVVMTVDVPEDAQDRAHDLNLRVLATAVGTSSNTNEVGAKAVLGTRIAIDATAWIGVGDALDLAPNFEIEGVDGVLINSQKFIRLFFANRGLVTIKPEGRLQLSDPAFADRIFEPLEFKAPEFGDGESGYVDVPVGDEVTDGFYRTFVTAESAGVRKTALFEGELIFDDPSKLTISEVAIRIAGFLAGAAGIAIALRLMRHRSKPVVTPELVETRRRRTPTAAQASSASAQSSSAKKTPAKAAPVKKTTNKAAPVKKPAEVSQSAKTIRKRAPTSARSKLQASETESKK